MIKEHYHVQPSPQETTPPRSGDMGFRLLRYFSIVSFIAVVAILLLAGFGLDAVLSQSVIEGAELEAVRMASVLRDFEMETLIHDNGAGGQRLSLDTQELPKLDDRMHAFLAPFDILKIKIYDIDTTIIYSTDASIIGQHDPHNAKLLLSLSGQPASKLESKDLVWDLENEQRPDIDLVETYVAIRGRGNAVLGSFEIYKDVTPELITARQTLVRSVGILLGTLIVVFSSLWIMMRFAARTIYQRTVALRESQQRYHTLAEISPVGIIKTDAIGNCTYVNERWSELAGLPASNAMQKGWTKCLHEEDRDRIYHDWFQTDNQEAHFRGEYRFCSPDGSTRWVFGQAVAERSDRGEVTGYVGTVTDITERKKAEETVRRHSEILEQTVKERTAELEAAKEKAEASSRAKSAFLANMSHELRTPLHGILSFAEFGAEQYKNVAPDILEEYFHRIRTSGKTLLTLLNNLLDLAKLESGTMMFERNKTEFSELVRMVTDEFIALAAERDLKVTFNHPPSAVFCEIDPERMKQVVRNLLSNAVKFSPAQGEIVIELASVNGSVQLSVCDQGPGIPVDELESIFDKFVQSSKTKTGAGGTGLGLSICRQIVFAHGGSIWAENNPASGARLTLMLPNVSGS